MSETRERPDRVEDEGRDVERSLLRAENERLRRELERSTRTTYRRTAVALLAVGLLSAVAGLLVPAAREVLVVVGAIGVFGGVLTWYLTPDRVLAASVTASVFDAHADTVAAIRDELGLREDPVYVPDDERVGGAVLFLPLHADYELPEGFDRAFVAAGEERARGVALRPSAAALAGALERSVTGKLDPGRLPAVVPEAVVEQFELADGADAELVDGTLTVEFEGLAVAGVDRPDHPVVSLTAVAAARAVDEPVRVEAADAGRVTVAW